MLRAILKAARRLDDHWLGDVAGAAFLFILLYEFLFFAEVFK